jgi:DksA/TraR C4-type zinc finger protein
MRMRVPPRHPTLDGSVPTAEEALPPPEEQAPTSTCGDCGGAILASRLKAVPSATRCTSCQREYESQTL